MRKIIRIIKVIFNRNRGFVIINISGLAIGLSVSLMLLLFVATELSYDRHFANRQRIVQLNTVWTEDGKRDVEPICLRKAYTDIPVKIPGIESAVQMYRGWDIELAKDQQRFQHIGLLYADPELFTIFNMVCMGGDLTTALMEPYSAVITDQLARKVFGQPDAVGKTFSIQEELYTVKAVVKELPANTHFSFDVLASMNSLTYLDNLSGLEFFTYYLLRPGVDQVSVCKAINNEYLAMLQEGFGEFNIEFESITLKLTDIYLKSPAGFGLGDQGSMESVFILAGLALLILLLAVTNFVNLFIVQGDKRAFEVGVRKTIGGTIKNIAFQFFSEATLIVLMAFMAGMFLAASCIGPFSSLIQKTIEPSLIVSPFFLSGIVVLILVTILLAASYPAFYLSRFKPSDALKKVHRPAKRRFTTSIGIFQSVITIVLIALILVVNQQLKYLRQMPKGYDTGNVLILTGVHEKVVTNYDALRQELQKLPEVQMVSGAHHVVGGGTSGQGIRLLESSDPTIKSINEYRVMPGLSELMKFKLAEGKSFGENASLNKTSIVINEAAAKMLGISGSATGRKVIMFEDPMEVIGVVKDFFYDTPARAVQPIALTCYRSTPSNIYIKFIPSVSRLKAAQLIVLVIRQVDPDFILNPRWCDDIYSGKFEKERSLSQIVSVSTALSLVIALLGMLAIHSYSAARRTKEIGIRKVMGSRSGSIVLLLSQEVIRVIVIAGVVSIPLSFYVAGTWLENYSNRIGISWYLLVIPILLQIVITVLATVWVSLRISWRNPVEALRYE